MTKEHECSEECACDEPKVTLGRIVENNNVMINVLTEVLVNKKVISEEDIRDAFAKIYGEATKK